MAAEYTPFTGQRLNVVQPTRTLHRLRRGEAIAEIRERAVTPYQAVEWLLFVGADLIESRMYHGERAPLYAAELAQVVADLQAKGWTLEPTPPPPQN